MTDSLIHFTFLRFVEDVKDGPVVEATLTSISVNELSTCDHILPIVFSLTFLLLLLLLIGLGIRLCAKKPLDAETGFNNCQSTKLSAGETMLFHDYINDAEETGNPHIYQCVNNISSSPIFLKSQTFSV